MPYIDLVWTGLATLGGVLLIGDDTFLRRTQNRKAWAGIWLIFVAFMFQVYWRFAHPWNAISVSHVIVVSVIIIFGFAWIYVLFKWFKRPPKEDFWGGSSYYD